jgi:hypothetical protein
VRGMPKGGRGVGGLWDTTRPWAKRRNDPLSRPSPATHGAPPDNEGRPTHIQCSRMLAFGKVGRGEGVARGRSLVADRCQSKGHMGGALRTQATGKINHHGWTREGPK